MAQSDGFREFLGTESRAADLGLRTYLLKVYNYMALGLLLTAGVGYYSRCISTS